MTTWPRTLRRRFGIAAPRVAIQTQAPWYVRVSMAALACLGVVAFGWLSYDLGRSTGGFDSGKAAEEQARLSELVVRLQDENQALHTDLAAGERQMQIEQATHGNLAAQLKSLSDENALLKEDLAFFQTLMNPKNDPANGIAISRVRIRPDTRPGEYRYQLLVVQARTRGKAFQGRLELVVDLLQDGQSQVLVLPGEKDKSEPYALNFKFYQRVEGEFQVPSSARVTRVQVRVLEDGVEAPRSSQTVTLS